MDLIVCGDALWISCSTWLQLWSGSIGAFVGAILAAGVALLVVFLTNRHQTAISERTQAELRREASLNREHAAIAEVIAVLSETIALVFDKPGSVHLSFGRFSAAIARWQLESEDKELRKELIEWPPHWWTAVETVQHQNLEEFADAVVFKASMDVVASMLTFARDWSSADPFRRATLQAYCEDARKNAPSTFLSQ